MKAISRTVGYEIQNVFGNDTQCVNDYVLVHLVQALLAASDMFDVAAVREACCDYMTRHIDVQNCVGIYCCADDHSCEKLKQHSMDFILEYFSDIYQRVSWPQLIHFTNIIVSTRPKGIAETTFSPLSVCPSLCVLVSSVGHNSV